MPVVAIDREPERSLLPPETLIPGTRVRDIATPGGKVGIWKAEPEALAAKLDELVESPHLVQQLSWDADKRAAELSWEVLGPRWQQMLVDVME
jgi:hypothetical protein